MIHNNFINGFDFKMKKYLGINIIFLSEIILFLVINNYILNFFIKIKNII